MPVCVYTKKYQERKNYAKHSKNIISEPPLWIYMFKIESPGIIKAHDSTAGDL